MEETKVTEQEVQEEKVEKAPKKDVKKLLKENEELKKEIETLKANEDYKDKWMRSVAEFDNYKKRNAKIWQDAYSEGKAEVILKILTVGDTLERAAQMEMDEKTKEGVSLILRSFKETLQSLGVEEIDPTGEKFNPDIAEALMVVDPVEGEESDTVKQVYQKGYKLGEKIIRFAKVIVTK